MTNWTKVAMDVGTGAGLGIADGLINDYDEKRATDQGVTKLPIAKQASTYWDYGLPVLAVFLTAFKVLDGDWARRIITGASVMGARKGVEQVRKKTEEVVPWNRWQREYTPNLDRPASPSHAKSGSTLEF